MKQYNQILYGTSAKQIGETANTAKPTSKFGLKGQFTNNLMMAGNFRNNGMNTAVDRERYMDQSRDWMDKIN